MTAAGYSYIPTYGSLFGDTSAFMNGPPLVLKGKIDVTLSWFTNMVQVAAYMLSAYFYVSNSKSNTYIYFVVLVFILATFDAFEEAKDVIPSASRISFKGTCSKHKSTEVEKEQKQVVVVATEQ